MAKSSLASARVFMVAVGSTRVQVAGSVYRQEAVLRTHT